MLALQAPTLGIALLVAHFEPRDYEEVAAAVNVLTFLSALDLGGGVLLASRVSLPGQGRVEAPLAAAALTLIPPILGASLFLSWAGLADRVELGGTSIWAVLVICTVAAIRSCLLLEVIALGTLDRPRSQALLGVAGSILALVIGGVLLAVTQSGLASLLGGLGISSAAALAAGMRSRALRSLVAESARLWRSGARLVLASARLSLGRTAIQVSSSAFVLAERSLALARLSGTSVIEYDVASRVMTIPRQAAAASAPSLIHRFASDHEGSSRAALRRHLRRKLITVSAIVVPGSLVVIVLLAPGNARAGALGAAGILSLGQLALLQTLPATAQLNASRLALREAGAHAGSLVLLGAGVGVFDPTSPAALAVVVVAAQIATFGWLAVWGVPRDEAAV